MVKSITSLNGAHPLALQKLLQTDPLQQELSRSNLAFYLGANAASNLQTNNFEGILKSERMNEKKLI
jgi:hypothetical protein